jgi:hypothetical protein
MKMSVRSFKDWSTGETYKPGLPYFTIVSADGSPPSVHIYSSHYDRMQAVVVAARSGNALLTKLALDHHDKCGSSA